MQLLEETPQVSMCSVGSGGGGVSNGAGSVCGRGHSRGRIVRR